MVAKLSTLDGSDWVANRYERVWWRQATAGPTRVVAAVSEQRIDVVLQMAAHLSGPFLLLWVLHTPCGGSQPGRYQSTPLTGEELRDLLRKYTPLFEEDGRSDLWVHSKEPPATIVLDHHDLIYAYGPLDAFVGELSARGFVEGSVAIPSPHAHEYRAECDDLERALAIECDWDVTALRPEDGQ
jgi:hypothetical protein